MTPLIVVLVILLGPSMLLALVLIVLTLRDLRHVERELDEADVEDHGRPLGSVVVLDHHRRAG